MRWQAKCLIDNGKAIIPFQDRLREWKQRTVGYQANTRNAPGTLADGLEQAAWIAEHFGGLKGLDVLEIGTGWEPIIPLIYRVAGARAVCLTDSLKLISGASLEVTLEFLARSKNSICAALRVAQAEFDNLLAQAGGAGEVQARLKALGLQYLAPCDCRSLPLDAGSLDVVFSRAVLEHIPEPVIRGIFRESRRLLRPGGAMCHFVDNSDHWEHRDKSISRINFLRQSEWVWRFTCVNPLNYQNRLRHQDYLNILREEGFRVVRVDREIDEKSLRLLPQMKLAGRFRGRSHDDLAAITSHILAVAA